MYSSTTSVGFYFLHGIIITLKFHFRCENVKIVSLCTQSCYKKELQKLSNDVTSESGITLCNKIDKPLGVYRFSGNVLTSIITLR